MPLSNDNGGEGWYIILAKDDYENDLNVGKPIRADSPEHAVKKRGMAGYQNIMVYQLRESATATPEYWEKSMIFY